MNEVIYQKVFDEIQDKLPENWNNVVFFVAYTEGSYNMKYYYSLDGKTYTDCYSEPGAKIPQIIATFTKVDKILSEERKALSIEKRWTVMTMIICSDGTFKTEYDYCDVSENMIAYEKEWKKKYIK